MAAVPDPVELRRAVEAKAAELGFALVGVTRAAPTARRAELERWIAEGRHGDMAWLAERVGEMCDVRTLLPGARSVISVADRYHDGRPDRVEDGRGRGRIARYARGKDYHDLVRDRLRKIARLVRELVPASTTRNCHDIQPVLEREQAARALLGAIGKHTLLLRPGLGSYFLLGEVITDAEIAPSDAPPGWESADGASRDACGACTRCIDACPTGAITPWSVDATRCTAYLTIEHRGKIADEFFGKTGDWWFGCDICQEVCPHGQPTRASRRLGASALHAPRLDSIDLLEVLGWSGEDRARLVVSSALKRATLPMMKRNALLALASVARGSQALRDAACARCSAILAEGREDEIVLAAADAALRALARSAE
jgi:epoxyqueuosine reductase